MFGFFVGTVCLVLLITSLRWRRHYAGFGPWSHYGSYAGGHSPRYGWHGPGSRGGFRRVVTQHILARLDTTPGQEKAIRQALEALQHNLTDAREDVHAARRDLARALGGDELDEQALSAALAKQETFVNRARGEIVQAIRTVHQTLDGKQRKLLAEWIAEGFSWRDLRGYW